MCLNNFIVFILVWEVVWQMTWGNCMSSTRRKYPKLIGFEKTFHLLKTQAIAISHCGE